MTRFSTEELAARFPALCGGPEPTEEDLAEAQRRREAAAIVRERERRDEAADELIAARGERYRHCRLSNFEVKTDDQKAVVERLQRFCQDVPTEVASGTGLILYGPSGTGKDHLMFAVAYAAVKSYGLWLTWKNGVALYSAFRAAIDGERSEDDVIRPLIEATILVLSDPLPPEGDLTRYQKEMLYRILESRYSARKGTWATLNVRSRKEVNERLGTACADRLRDGAVCLFCNWPTHRKPKD